MIPPLLSYITFNRLGLTIRNLDSILKTTDDFEMHIIDNNSYDGTWEYIQSVNDSRIKSKTQIGVNSGQIYSLNTNLLRRHPEQYFITVDNDVYIETKDWITRFMDVFNAFPEVGLLGIQKSFPYSPYLPPVTSKVKDGILYLELNSESVDTEQNFVPGCCQCLKPELINKIGYWSEENGFGDAELSYRINRYLSFKLGIVPNISTKMFQTIDCAKCSYKEKCKLDKDKKTCFTIYSNLYKNDTFAKKFNWKFVETLKDMESGARPVYCASALDATSLSNNIFNTDWALENFRFYLENSN